MGRNKSRNMDLRTMSVVHPNAAAIDVGATMHTAAVNPDRTAEPVRSFGTFTADLHRLIDWFVECGVDTVVMESTSVYWIPIFELLDARGFAVFLVNWTSEASRLSSSMRAMPSTSPDARVTSVMRSGCSGFTPSVCCAQAFGPKVRSPNCVPTCVSVSVCWSMGRLTSNICRRH